MMVACKLECHTPQNDPIVVGGHKDVIQRGPKAADDVATITKKSTGWEVLMYLGMALRINETMCALAAIAPSVVAILCLEGEHSGVWIYLEKKENRLLLEAIHEELQKTSAHTHGCNQVMDRTRWVVCLIDVTDGMCLPCVADIKIGYIRHSPHTPPEKLERIKKKRLVQPLALRLCGALHYFYRTVSNEQHIEKEICGKDMGYLLHTSEDHRDCFQAFFSSTVSMSPDGTGTRRDDSDIFFARLRACRKQIERILLFFNSSLGCALLERTAFVSTSLLLVYDAANCVHKNVVSKDTADVQVYLIDYARVCDRRLNFSEEKIGFMRGLENIIRLFS
ncbi:putative inositol polyphosphate kinase [Trypanosoma rangeli]|uniref:Kinase n=1 Tax=Trypanosoma rangeli TaxID=5698 RepID=A0A422N9V2_TRYRA|nr:putative inositol polyphosphate kinase [Trypanosoma rangeli]RNF02268.1 putative inositol polyphosphate kinase [Trypanosoma rangeli]|eukprot:RNF02268.1 putative inositol polyphosphate kinase [Trypanosoma rangeli]